MTVRGKISHRVICYDMFFLFYSPPPSLGGPPDSLGVDGGMSGSSQGWLEVLSTSCNLGSARRSCGHSDVHAELGCVGA